MKLQKLCLHKVFNIGSTTKVNCHELYFFYTQFKMYAVFLFYTQFKMSITPVLLKNYSLHNFLNRSKLRVCLFLFKKTKKNHIKKCLCHVYFYDKALTWTVHLTSNVFAYLLIIFLGHDWFGFFLNKWGCIRSTP